MSAKIMALDLSLRSTGMVVLSDDGRTLASTNIKPPVRLRNAPRLAYILSQIKLCYRQREPWLVVIEEYAFAAKGMVFSIGELGGVVRLWLWENDIPFLLINPSHLKKFVSGKGNCPKERILLAAYKKWNIEIPQTDIVEAFCLAKMGFAVIDALTSNKSDLKSYEEDVLNKIYDTNNPAGTYDVKTGTLKQKDNVFNTLKGIE